MLEAVSNNTERQSLYSGLRLRRSSSIGEDSGQLGHLGKPPPVLFSLDVNSELHVPILRPPLARRTLQISGEGRAASPRRTSSAASGCSTAPALLEPA